MEREATVSRKTRETDITVELRLDGKGEAQIETGIPFFDHLLDSFTRHGLFDLRVRAKGDLQVDQHHTVEDVGIVLGQALRRAIGDGAGLRRFGSARIPMADARMLVDLDLSNRPYLVYRVELTRDWVADFDGALVEDFLYAFSTERRDRSARRALVRSQRAPHPRRHLQGTRPRARRSDHDRPAHQGCAVDEGIACDARRSRGRRRRLRHGEPAQRRARLRADRRASARHGLGGGRARRAARRAAGRRIGARHDVGAASRRPRRTRSASTSPRVGRTSASASACRSCSTRRRKAGSASAWA